jgi:hypothetical protein
VCNDYNRYTCFGCHRNADEQVIRGEYGKGRHKCKRDKRERNKRDHD